jgi:hypothetical protein
MHTIVYIIYQKDSYNSKIIFKGTLEKEASIFGCLFFMVVTLAVSLFLLVVTKRVAYKKAAIYVISCCAILIVGPFLLLWLGSPTYRYAILYINLIIVVY